MLVQNMGMVQLPIKIIERRPEVEPRVLLAPCLRAQQTSGVLEGLAQVAPPAGGPTERLALGTSRKQERRDPLQLRQGPLPGGQSVTSAGRWVDNRVGNSVAGRAAVGRELG